MTKEVPGDRDLHWKRVCVGRICENIADSIPDFGMLRTVQYSK